MTAYTLPEGWVRVPLDPLISIEHGFAFKSENFSTSGVYAITTPGNFYEEGGFRDVGSKQRYYIAEFPRPYILQPGDLIVAMTEQADGLLGSAAIVPADRKYLHNQRIGRVRIRDKRTISLDYVPWVFNSREFRVAVNQTAAGTKVRHTSPAKLASIDVPLPPIEEQVRIAACLGDVEDLACSLERLIAKKQSIKQGMIQELLSGRSRLPGFTAPWGTTTIGDACTTFSGGTPSTARSDYYGGEIPWIASGDLNKHRIMCVDGRITRLGLERSAAKLVPAGTPLIALYGATAGVAAITEIEGAINQAVLAMVPRKIDAEFLFQWLGANRSSIIDRYTQGGQPNLSGAIVRSVEVPLPDPIEQREIARALREVDSLVATLVCRLDKAVAIKQGLMQELLTGRTRLPVKTVS